MAGGSVTTTGLTEVRQWVDRLPDRVTALLKGAAHRAANRLAHRAAEILNAKTHGEGKTAAAIKVVDESEDRQFFVASPGAPDRPANLPLWLERGTRHMSARAYLRPAGEEVESSYRADSEAALARLND